MQQSSAAQLLAHFRALGFHAYVIQEDYEVARGSAAAVEPATALAPRRLKAGETLESLEQADVIFSRRDVDFL